MATYAIGDIQGCASELRSLLAALAFDAAQDRVWFVGDLVNRGPASLETLRFVRSLGDAARVVLGNHDLHFLALHYTQKTPRRSDTLSELLQASDVAELADWLRSQPLVYEDPDLPDWLMSHAGVPPGWSLKQTRQRAAFAHDYYAGPKGEKFFAKMYGNEPNRFSDKLTALDKTRCVVNHLTRMRMIAKKGHLDFDYKGSIADAPPSLQPWFKAARDTALGKRVLFGHWAALGGETNNADAVALDTGCAWGDRLTALCLETQRRHSVPAESSQQRSDSAGEEPRS